MRILDVSPKAVLPPNTGSRVRIWNLMRRLAEQHEVRQFSQAPRAAGMREHLNQVSVSPTYAELQYSSASVRFFCRLAELPRDAAPPLRGTGLAFARPARLDSLMRWADVVVVEFPWQFAYCRRRRGDAPIVLATHNVEAARFASVARANRGPNARHRWGRAIERVERRAVLGADLVLAVSDEDRAELCRRYGVDPDRVAVVPNGVDITAYAPAAAEARTAARHRLGLPDRPTVLYTGSDTAPNRAGLAWIGRLARATPQLSFVVVGEVSAGLTGEPFSAQGVVNDMAPFLQAADVAICPIEYGGGTKIKLLEALGAGLPTIAFAEAIEGLAVRDREHVRVVPKQEAAIVAALEELAADGELAERIGRGGREYVCAHHDWERIGDGLERELVDLVAGDAAQRARRSRVAP